MLTLGISNNRWHDSAVALLEDGEIVFAAAEERFSRIKHDRELPRGALRAALAHAGASLSDVDGVAFGWNRPGYDPGVQPQKDRHRPQPVRRLRSGPQPLRPCRACSTPRAASESSSASSGPLPPGGARFIDHHEAHAWSAYAAVGLRRRGRAGGGRPRSDPGHVDLRRPRRRAPAPQDLPRTRTRSASSTRHSPITSASVRTADEWKVMGLAAYGAPTVPMDEFIRVSDDDYWVNRHALREKGPRRSLCYGRASAPGETPRRSCRRTTGTWPHRCRRRWKRRCVMLARNAVRLTGRRNLCLAGGVAMNSKANGAIAASGLVDRLFIQPAATDDGTALGAAIAASAGFDPSMPDPAAWSTPTWAPRSPPIRSGRRSTAQARLRRGPERRGGHGPAARRPATWSAGSRGAWSSAPARSGTARSSATRATPRRATG